jgi:hypothetical protein
MRIDRYIPATQKARRTVPVDNTALRTSKSAARTVHTAHTSLSSQPRALLPSFKLCDTRASKLVASSILIVES